MPNKTFPLYVECYLSDVLDISKAIENIPGWIVLDKQDEMLQREVGQDEIVVSIIYELQRPIYTT